MSSTEGLSPDRDSSFFQDVIEELSQTIYMTDREGYLIYVNNWGFREYGYTRQDLKKGVRVLDTIAPEDRDRCQKNIEDIIEGKSGDPHEYLALRKDGTRFPVIIYSSCYFKEGAYTGLRGVIFNIQERREKERLLSESERRYQNLVEQSPDGIIIHQDGIVVFANTAAVRIMGVENVDDILGKQALEYVHPDDRDMAIQRIQKVLSDTEARLPPVRERFRRLDGSYILARVYSIPFSFEGRPAVQVVFSDITEQEQLAHEKEELQNQLYQSQKLEAVGTLAGGIAHDFNNLLTVIIGNAELILIKPDRDFREDLQGILHSAKTAATLTRRLLSFSRKQAHDRENFNGDSIIKDMKNILSRLVGENYQINLDLKAPDTYIYSSKTELEHILINLVVNSRDAMSRGGEIDISSDEIQVETSDYPSLPPIQPGDYYRVIVQDYGIGMSRDVQQHLFDPFFSTKDQDKGTGLGLSTVYAVVSRNEGGIEVNSEENIGTCFKIMIPVSSQISSRRRINSSVRVQKKGKKLILLVEDDLDVRIITRQMLEDMGYQVFSTGDMREAFALYGRHKDDLDLIVADIRLPDGTGIEMADIIQEQHPALPVLFISGYCHMKESGLSRDGLPREYLSKPFDRLSLTQALAKLVTGGVK